MRDEHRTAQVQSIYLHAVKVTRQHICRYLPSPQTHTHIHILYTQRNQCALKYFVLWFSYTSIIREELFFKGFPGCHILLLFDEEAQVLVL